MTTQPTNAFVTTEGRCSICKSKLTNAETARLNWQEEAHRLKAELDTWKELFGSPEQAVNNVKRQDDDYVNLKAELEKAQAACASLAKFNQELCEDTNVSNHYPSTEAARNCGHPLLDRLVRLENALTDLFSLVESAALVRDTSKDSNPG